MRSGVHDSAPFPTLPIMDIIAQYPLLSASEERSLITLHVRGDTYARERLILSNLRLVVWIAKRGMRIVGEAQFTDLISAGIVGLIRAVDKVDEHFSSRFATYAIWWIKQSISATIETSSRIVPVPHRYVSSMRRFQKAEQSLSHRLMRPPTLHEIADELGVSEKEAYFIRALDASEVSLDAPLTVDEGGLLLGDVIADDSGVTAVDMYACDVARRTIGRACAGLAERERMVITLRYGLFGYKTHALAEVGEVLGVSFERVRQIEQRAINKMRFGKTLRNKTMNFM